MNSVTDYKAKTISARHVGHFDTRFARARLDTAMDSATAHLIEIMTERVKSLRAEGNLVEAHHAATALVEKTEMELNSDIDRIDAFVKALEIRGSIYREAGKYEEAIDDYSQAIELIENQPNHQGMVGRLHAAIGACYDELDDASKTAEHWQHAITSFEHNDPPLLIDVATMYNNLGFLNKAQEDFDSAENCFLRSLEILHEQLGKEHEQTASVLSNLGALYQRAGYHEQSREMHMVALEARLQALGEDHPDTAQSHNNLALALLETGDRDDAKSHFEQALKTFETLGKEYYYDLDAVATNYCEYLRQEGDNELAESIDTRINQLLSDAGMMAS